MCFTKEMLGEELTGRRNRSGSLQRSSPAWGVANEASPKLSGQNQGGADLRQLEGKERQRRPYVHGAIVYGEKQDQFYTETIFTLIKY